MRIEDMSFTDYLMAECDLRERQRKERMKQKEFEKYAKEHNLFVCSTNILEQIKAEIDEQTEIHSDGEFYIKNFDVKRILAKYTKGESE